MVPARRLSRIVVFAALAALLAFPLAHARQSSTVSPAPVSPADDPLAAISLPEPGAVGQPIAENRGAAQLEQSLKRLQTTASLMMIVAHPDDEDGALLAYLSRALGVRCTCLRSHAAKAGRTPCRPRATTPWA